MRAAQWRRRRVDEGPGLVKTAIVAAFGMANTTPVTDSAPRLRGLVERAREDAVVPIGFFAAVTCGLPNKACTRGSATTSAARMRFADVAASELPLRASAKMAFA